MKREESQIKKVLVVDDEEVFTEMIIQTLSKPDLTVTTAPNGLRAMELIRKERFDVVISDIIMPQMNGIDFLVRLRDEHFTMPIIFITGDGDKDKVLEAWRLGTFDFIFKPFRPDYLRQVVNSALLFGASFNKNSLPDANRTEVTISLESGIALNLEQYCLIKNVDKSALVGSLIAKFIASSIHK